jgi:hypothetical protein
MTVLLLWNGKSTSSGLLKMKNKRFLASSYSFSSHYLEADNIVPITDEVSPPSVTEITISPFCILCYYN